MSDLLNVDEALMRILNSVERIDDEQISLEDALGRVLFSEVIAQENLPPFANSSMDGYAVRAEDTVSAGKDHPFSLSVIMDIPAGVSPTGKLEAGQCARIMTGAPVPEGADAVIPVEDTDQLWDRAETPELPHPVNMLRSVKTGDNVRPVGENVRAGEFVLGPGAVLNPAEIGILAALGISKISVVRRPKVVIVSTGDELVEVHALLVPGKIRDVNSYTVAALVRALGAEAIKLPIARDTPDAVRAVFQQALDLKPDMIISSAGVSVGAADFVKDVLSEMGSVDFWRINLRPGKPLAYGQLGGVPFFGLPGNPVSVMVTFDVFVRPTLQKMAGYEPRSPLVDVTVQEDLTSDGRRSYLRVKLEKRDEKFFAATTGTQSSGALISMVLADALLIIPEGVKHVSSGSTLKARILREI